jgi:hypothetical protein
MLASFGLRGRFANNIANSPLPGKRRPAGAAALLGDGAGQAGSSLRLHGPAFQPAKLPAGAAEDGRGTLEQLPWRANAQLGQLGRRGGGLLAGLLLPHLLDQAEVLEVGGRVHQQTGVEELQGPHLALFVYTPKLSPPLILCYSDLSLFLKKR